MRYLTLALAFLIISCGEQKAKKIETETTLAYQITYNHTINSFQGRVNLPEGTKLSITVIKDKQPVAQSDVVVKDEQFSVSFSIPAADIDEFEISCFANEFWQSDNIIKQLKFIESDLWKDDELKIVYQYWKDYEMMVRAIINTEKSYEPVGRIENVTDASMGKIKRVTANIVFPEKLSDEEVEREMRYSIYKIWQTNKSAKAIAVKCFYKNEGMSFKAGYFAPEGEWSKAGEEVPIDKYQVKI